MMINFVLASYSLQSSVVRRNIIFCQSRDLLLTRQPAGAQNSCALWVRQIHLSSYDPAWGREAFFNCLAYICITFQKGHMDAIFYPIENGSLLTEKELVPVQYGPGKFLSQTSGTVLDCSTRPCSRVILTPQLPSPLDPNQCHRDSSQSPYSG